MKYKMTGVNYHKMILLAIAALAGPHGILA